jgi:hypothetical protein
MLRRHWDCPARHTPLDDVSLFILGYIYFTWWADPSLYKAPTMSPKAPDIPTAGSNIYRQDTRPQQIFDLDLDLNPDL